MLPIVGVIVLVHMHYRFLGGTRRAASSKARIGFHSFRIIGARNSTRASAILQKVDRDVGLSDEFVRRVFDQFWYRATSELISDG